MVEGYLQATFTSANTEMLLYWQLKTDLWPELFQGAEFSMSGFSAEVVLIIDSRTLNL